MTATTLSIVAMVLSIAAQLTNQTPSDARSNQFEEPKGTSWRVFGVDSYPDGPIAITEVEEIRQQNPPSTWGVHVKNRSSAPVTSFALAAAIVTGDGNVKAIQPLPTIKNLKPNQAVRREMRVTVAVLMPTDRVVFFVNEVSDVNAVWKAVRADTGALIKSAANRLPVP
jgi:hypothetical protein